jgi:hypothetical protein
MGHFPFRQRMILTTSFFCSRQYKVLVSAKWLAGNNFNICITFYILLTLDVCLRSIKIKVCSFLKKS